MRRLILAAVLAVFAAVPAMAGNNDWLGTFRPSYGASFNGGLTEFNNSIGMSVGGNVGLLRFGPMRFPTVGADLGALSKCPPAGPDNDCRMTCAVLLSGGADFILARERDSDDRTTGEKALSVALTRVVLGPLRESWGLRIGMSFRYRGASPR